MVHSSSSKAVPLSHSVDRMSACWVMLRPLSCWALHHKRHLFCWRCTISLPLTPFLPVSKKRLLRGDQMTSSVDAFFARTVWRTISVEHEIKKQRKFRGTSLNDEVTVPRWSLKSSEEWHRDKRWSNYMLIHLRPRLFLLQIEAELKKIDSDESIWIPITNENQGLDTKSASLHHCD